MVMACLNTLNNEQQSLCSSVGPRISFSSDFVDAQQAIKHENSYREAPVSSDFEFSVPTYSMISADELFSKGKMLPLKDNCAKMMTLREELLIEDEYEDVPPRLPKGSSRWKERLGLKRTHMLPKKSDRNDGTLERIEETKSAEMVHEEIYARRRS